MSRFMCDAIRRGWLIPYWNSLPLSRVVESGDSLAAVAAYKIMVSRPLPKEEKDRAPRRNCDMKIIFSRKGFDGENGGVPSPIFPDGTLLSLPIPRKSQFSYGQLSSPQKDFPHVGEIVEHLTNYRMSDSCRVHLDPDLDARSIDRAQGWRGIFGQSGAAQGHLEKEGIGTGDLFLFFGQFCRVEPGQNGQLRYVKGRPTQHVIFGWLRVGSPYRLPEQKDQVPAWAKYHAHLNCAGIEPVPNVIYTAADRLDSDTELPGWGIFRRFSEDLCLSHPGQTAGKNGKAKPSLWRLPAWMNPWRPENGRSPLTYHGTQALWKGSDERFSILQTAGRGQEFVLNADEYPEAWPWAKSLINAWGCKGDKAARGATGG